MKIIGFTSHWIGMVMLCVCFLGCERQETETFYNTDLTGNAQYGKHFIPSDTDGNRRSLTDFKGQIVIFSLGYTHCPDVCPTTLAELAQALKQLGRAAEKIQVLFMTVDPERDTPEVLARYLAAFDRRFIGLYPLNEAELKKVAKDFRLYYAKIPSPGIYGMDHTAASYVFDSSGVLRLYARAGEGVARWLHDLNRLLKESSG